MRAYLSIMQTRLGRRLDFAVSIPPALGDVPLPPGMLITLVENAIKHGIEPHAPGGRVEVTARATEDRVEIDVADTGAGLDESAEPGTGIGLANVRERLSLLYGERASLELFVNQPRGFRARLAFPREAPPSKVPFVPVMAAHK